MATSHFTTTEAFETKIKKLAADYNMQMSSNEKQQISIIGGTPISGSFVLSLDGYTTSNINYNATSATIASALCNVVPSLTPADLLINSARLPGEAIIVTFVRNWGNKAIPLMQSAVVALEVEAGDDAAEVIIERLNTGYGDNVIAARRLEQAYNIIESYLMVRGLTREQISTWARGEEYQLDIATYWYCKDSGWGGKAFDEKDWTKVFDRASELATVPIINNDGELLSEGKSYVTKAFNLLDINKSLGIYY